MNILGISGLAQRIKNQGGFPSRSLEMILRLGGTAERVSHGPAS